MTQKHLQSYQKHKSYIKPANLTFRVLSLYTIVSAQTTGSNVSSQAQFNRTFISLYADLCSESGETQ